MCRVVEIDVVGHDGSTSIVDGETAETTQQGTDFGNAEIVAGSVVRSFEIKNIGDATLTLEGVPVVSGADSSDFTVSGLTDSDLTIAGSAAQSFTITFTPSSIQAKEATVTILSDDFDEASYDFSLTGFGQATTTIP
jgi:hypothetical protein